MAALSWSFWRPKPKPPLDAVSPRLRALLDAKFKSVEPSETLRADFRRYAAWKQRQKVD